MGGTMMSENRADSTPDVPDRTSTTKRSYMASEDRRRHLLDAGARLIAREGMSGFTMVALAAEAKVSRPLVYRHFPDLDTFFAAFFIDQAHQYMRAVDEAHERSPGLDAVTAAYHYLLGMPDGDLRAMSTLVNDLLDPRLVTARSLFRERVVERWQPIVRDMQVESSVLSAALWLVVGTAVTIATLVRLGDLTEEQGQTLLFASATGTMANLAIASA